MASLQTKLDAVNQMLEAVWESPVSTLEVSGIASVALAKRVLDESLRSIQSRGWHFNTDLDLTLTPDVNGELALPANTLRVDSYGDDKDRDVAHRGTRLYDRDDHTYVFTKPIQVEIVYLLEFEECPQCVRTYVALMAERVFKDKFTAAAAPSPITAEEMEALRNVEDQEAQQGDYNMLTGSWSVANILQRE
jgi:hypothetical protein